MNVVVRQPLTRLKHPFRVQFYDQPPEDELHIEEFEKLALARLHVLKAVETARIRNKKDHEFESYLSQIEKKHLPLSKSTDIQADFDEERRRDLISHYILRLAYCRTEDLRRWFLNQECALFRYRFEGEPTKDKEDFIVQQKLGYEPISRAERLMYEEQLKAASSHIPHVFEREFYKVPFEHATELVAQRKVFVRDGCAYVPVADLVSLLVGDFRMRLSRSLMATAKILPRLEDDDRLMPMLETIGRQHVGPDYSHHPQLEGQITADTITEATTHFPLCMQHLHTKLLEIGHLKYGGRLQYGLFLKGIGMSLDEALVFWKKAFSKKTPEDKFNKDYAYHIRHSYGQEGKRANYAPYNCVKIITSHEPSTGDHHGCPFKHFNADSLRATLQSRNVPERTIHEILELVRHQHFQIACTRYFEASRKTDEQMDIIAHPNEYFDRSLKLSKLNKIGNDAK